MSNRKSRRNYVLCRNIPRVCFRVFFTSAVLRGKKKSVRPFCDRSCNTRAILSVRKLFTHCAYRSEQNRYFTIYKPDMPRGRFTQSCMILDASSHPIGSCTVWRHDKYIHSFTLGNEAWCVQSLRRQMEGYVE